MMSTKENGNCKAGRIIGQHEMGIHSGGTERNLSKNKFSTSISIAVIKFSDFSFVNQSGAERVYFSFQVI